MSTAKSRKMMMPRAIQRAVIENLAVKKYLLLLFYHLAALFATDFIQIFSFFVDFWNNFWYNKAIFTDRRLA